MTSPREEVMSMSEDSASEPTKAELRAAAKQAKKDAEAAREEAYRTEIRFDGPV